MSEFYTIQRVERFKTSLQCVLLPYRQFYAALDACKAADYVVFVLSPTTEVDSWGELLMRSLQAQGLPEVVSVVHVRSSTSQNPQTLTDICATNKADEPADTTTAKSRSLVLKSLLSFMQYFAPTQARVHDLCATSGALNAARAVCEGRPDPVRWREGRAHVLAENVEWEGEGGEEVIHSYL